MHILDAQSGATVAKIRAARTFWQSRHGPLGLAEMSGQAAMIETQGWRIAWRAPVAGFALLAAAFSPRAVLISDSTDPDEGQPASVSCFDLTGRERWRVAAASDCNFPWLGWNEASNEWRAIEHHVNNLAPDTLRRWTADGEQVASLPLGLDIEYAFLPNGRSLVTSDGRVLDTRSGEETQRLALSAVGGAA